MNGRPDKTGGGSSGDASRYGYTSVLISVSRSPGKRSIGNCDSATVTIEVVNTIIPYNGMSVDGDGKNDHFHIGGIESYPNNVVRIYNRWGVKVFETEGYDNVTRVFRGISNGRVTVNAPEKLPQGTYYYVIEYYDSNNNKESLVGWLYLKK